MTRNRRIIVISLLAAVTLATSVVALFLRSQRQDIAVAKSPDGTWSVAVVGQKILFGLGGIEIVVEPRGDLAPALRAALSG